MFEHKKIRSVFIDEAMERILEIEKGLLQLEQYPDDEELINTIFRAAHTIKGSSASIGLNELSGFTHGIEEILDLVRLRKLIPGKELISQLLESSDLLKEMVTSLASDMPFDFTKCENSIIRMGDLKNKILLKQFKIIFIPDHHLFRKGLDPADIIAGLRDIGEVTNIKAFTDEVPALSEISPDELYLRWDISIRTDRDLTDIRKVFEFVEEGSDIKIFPVIAPDQGMPLLGQMLVEEGTVKAEDIAEALKVQKRLGEILVEHDKVAETDIKRMVDKQSLKKIELFKNSVSSTIRVDLKKLDHLINIVGEMVIIHSMFQQIIHGNGNLKETPENLDALFSQLQRIGKDIQESAMSLRMLPVGEVFQRFSRLVRELSGNKDKRVELVMAGEETELDKGVLEKITDPLVHLIRNAIDHGMETSGERTAIGKPPYGKIHLIAYQMGDSVYIEIEDDGKGLDREKIIEKAIAKGVIKDSSGLSDDQIYNLIFLPGFSTADEVSDVSGRGVGMDVVRKNIESLNGKVYMHTKPGIGTTISIKLPLTLAIIDGLTVLLGNDAFVIPITSVIESLRPRREDVKTLNEKCEVINVRGEFIPLIRLYEQLDITPLKKDPSEAIVVLVSHENKKRCLLVDDLVGQQQVVIKKLGTAMPKVFDVAGGTILGNGRIALVLDVPGIIENVTLSV